MATDEFINHIIDALNQYTIDLAKAQIRIAFEQAERNNTFTKEPQKG